MKKIYSFMLLAAAMLLSISVKAEVLTVGTVEDGGTYQSLLAAFNDANDGDEIKLVSNITSNDPIHINHGSITLNLNGHNVLTDAILRPFYLYKGTLRVTGTGEIRNSYNAKNVQIFYVYGSFFPTANYTHLIIEENVSLVVPNGPKGRGIQIATSISSEGAIETIKNETIPYNGIMGSSWGFAHGVVIDVYGDITVTTTEGYCIQISGRVRHAGDYAGQTKTYNGTTQTIQTDWADYAPVINLYSTCHLIANSSSTGAAAIYAAGYATWNLKGCEAEGSCALAIKSGNITVTDATLKSTATEYKQPTDKTAGIDTQGSAVLIESNNTYSGTISVTFEGDTRIEAKAGYAIQEAIPNVNSNSDSHVSSFNIEGGAFVGGTETGCIIVSEGTLGNPTSSITIGGGSYEDQTDAQKEATDQLISHIISGGNTYTTEVSTGSTSGTGVALVITSGTTPEIQPASFDISDLYAKNSNSENPEDWNSIDLSNVIANTTFELELGDGKGNLTLGDVVMNGEDLTIIVDSGVTFTAKQLIMNDKARIIVKAGGKLIVTGEQGIIAPVVDNILVEAVEGNMGMFLFNPAVSSNKHPNGTVQLVSQGYRDGGQYVWQRFGVPVYEGLLRTQIAKVGHEYGTGYMFWDFEKAGGPGWNDVALDQVMKPFEGFIMTTNTDHAGAKYAMSGALYGNVPAPLAYVPGWNYFANSYTAEIDIRALIEKYIESGSIEGAIQINTSSASNLWESIVLADLNFNEAAQTKLFPMQGFITKSKNDEIFKDTINYASMIWAHKDEANVSPAANSAPARRNMMSADYTNAVVVIASAEGVQKVTLRQGEQFSNEFDNGYEASCYKNNLFNIYANSENGEMSQIATDNLMGQTLSIESAKAATFKMTFKNLRGETLAIRDNMTGSVINMVAGEEYFFSVAPGTTTDRFEIVEAAKMPTDVEALQAAPAKKGIYTLVGQYLGENFDVLPAGIYVVNGKKVVK